MRLDAALEPAAAEAYDLAALLGMALLDDAGWERFLLAATRLLPNGRATLLHHDPAAGSGALQLGTGIPEELLTAYRERLASVNPWIRAAAGRPLGRVSTTRTVMPAAELRRTAFHADFLRPLDLGQGLGLTLDRRDGIDFALSLLGADGDEAGMRGAAAVLQGIAPRIADAFAARRRMAMARDTSRFGTLRLGARGVVVEADAGARDILAAGAPFRVDVKGRLRCRDGEVETALAGLLAEWGMPADGTAVWRWLLPRGPDRLPLRATLTRPGRTAVDRYFAGPEAVLTLEDPELDELDLEPLRAFFGLTGAEARALASLMAGRTVAETAALHGTGLETVRSQVKALLHKTACRSQAELVGLTHRLGRF